MTTSGESHGPAETCILEGIPAGLALDAAFVERDLARRQGGYGRGGRMAIEKNRCRFLGGVRHGLTMGSPICIVVENSDFENWSVAMSPAPLPEGQHAPEDLRPVRVPRPGHADLGGISKYGFAEARNVLERASARETVGRVAGGAVCRRFLQELGVVVRARVVSIGSVRQSDDVDARDPGSVDWRAVEQSPVGCDDPAVGRAMCEAIDEAKERGESLGGVFEVWCWGLCPGIGGYDRFECRLDGRLMGAIGSIPAIKGVEIGAGFDNAGLPGSQVHDAIVMEGSGASPSITRATNRAGGIEGGMTTGLPIIIRAAMKPIPTLMAPLASIELPGMNPTTAHVERSDVCAVPAARVVGEAMAAYVLAGFYLEKFGGDSMIDIRASLAAYEGRLESRGLWSRS